MTIREAIETLQAVGNKELPLRIRVKYLDTSKLKHNFVDADEPNQTAYEYDEPEQVVIWEFLPRYETQQ